jgi:propanediol utilization protein
MKLPDSFIIERSANHCHLSKENAMHLFWGRLPIFKSLTIEGEFATNLKVFDNKGNKYTVLYPWRSYSQLELAQSDYYKLFGGYDKRVSSGELRDARNLIVRANPGDTLSISIPVITVKAHVHLNDEKDLWRVKEIDFPFPLDIKFNKSTDGLNHIHLDTDQFAAIQGL